MGESVEVPADHGPREIEVIANGLRFGALQWGPSSGPLALCLHGFPDTAWELATSRFPARSRGLAGGRAVHARLCPDRPRSRRQLRGCRPGRDAVALHDALDGDDRAVLIGHDWGAAATYLVAAQERCPFARTVCLAIPAPAAIFAVRDPRLLARQLRLSWYMLFNQVPELAERALPALIRSLWRSWSVGYEGSFEIERVDEALATRARRSAALGYYRRCRDRRAGASGREREPGSRTRQACTARSPRRRRCRT